MASEKVKRPQSRGEELANTISHGVGAVLALAGAAPLAVRGILSGSAKAGFSLTAYAVSLVLLYGFRRVPRSTAAKDKACFTDYGSLLHLRVDPGHIRTHVPAGSRGHDRLDAVSDQYHLGSDWHYTEYD